MIDAGYAGSLIQATDLADTQLWRHIGGGVGAVALIDVIMKRLQRARTPDAIIADLLGVNVTRALAFQPDS